ncbi:MAG: HDIG domain-containing metalloprotein, partial [Salibacteraceae bacterium]
LQRTAALLISVLIVFLFLPNEGLFKYEYQVNQPWKHDKLFAPFEFGIRKSDEQIENEKQLLIKGQPPVFVFEKSVTERVLHDIDERWSIEKDSLFSCDSLRTLALSLASELLHEGLIQQNDYTRNLSDLDAVFLEQNNLLERHSYGDLWTINQAVDTVGLIVDQVRDSACSELFRSVMLAELQSNVIYNDSLTQKLLQGKFDQIIGIEGKVNRGQLIIDRGEVVTDEKIQILESLRREYSERTISDTGVQWSIVGELGLMTILLGLLMLFVFMNQSRLFNDPRPITLTLSLITLSFVIVSLAYSSASIPIYVIPIGIAPLLMRMFFDFRVSIFSFIILVLMTALFSANPFEYIVLQISAISFATLYQSSSTKRSRMLGTAFLVFLGYGAVYTIVTIAQNGNLNGVVTANYGWFAINGLLCTMVFPLIYVVEKVFGYVSETTLLELSDSNQPLLKELAVKAPGTFQHSLQVANLAEKVAGRIGGNTVLLRTAALYHDIGKMDEPHYFIENQLPDNNPHDDLEPDESAEIIIGHVKKGIIMARSNNIPIDIIQFIQTHHGTSTVRYFLNKAKERNPDIEESYYRYPGPRPNTKEQAILMMADSVEAASRSLKKYDHQSIEKLVDGIIGHQQSEGQFEDAPITFRDVTIAKHVLKTLLKGIYHQRISYD